MDSNKQQKNIHINKKEWKKPTLITIRAAELTEYIKAAARSGNCYTFGR